MLRLSTVVVYNIHFHLLSPSLLLCSTVAQPLTAMRGISRKVVRISCGFFMAQGHLTTSHQIRPYVVVCTFLRSLPYKSLPCRDENAIRPDTHNFAFISHFATMGLWIFAKPFFGLKFNPLQTIIHQKKTCYVRVCFRPYRVTNASIARRLV